MRLLFGLLSPGLGGHTRTALALAEVLRDRGHQIDFVVATSRDGGPRHQADDEALVRRAGFDVERLPGLYAWPGQSSFGHHLRDLTARGQYDVLHWFEFYDGVRDAARVAQAQGCAFVWTVASGGPPIGYFGLNRVVVFTDEVAADVRQRSPTTAVHVLPARLNVAALRPHVAPGARANVRAALGVSSSALLIVRVARCANVYLRGVRLGAALASRLTQAGREAVFVHAGYVQEPAVALEIQALVERANRDAGRCIAMSLTGDVAVGARFAGAADVCIASGRSALEALALERPTFIAWGPQYLGLVDDANIAAIAATNFQGRHAPEAASDDAVVQDMEQALLWRLANPAEARDMQQRCARFIVERYSVERAADVYEHLYEDRAVSVDVGLRHYTQPAHLVREALHRLPEELRARLRRAFGSR